MDMDNIDIPLICLTIVTYLIGQTVIMLQQNKRRAKLAVQQREDYFTRLTQETNQTDEEMNANINRLREENDKILSDLRQLGVDPEDDDDDEYEEDEFGKVVERLKTERDGLDKKIAKCCEELGVSLVSGNSWRQGLEERINRLKQENENLRKQLEGQDLRLLPTSRDKLDPQLLQYLDEHMDDLNSNSLKELYETLLEIDRDELDKFLSGEANYETELVELDRRRIKAERRLKQTRERYQDELTTFNETRLEYLFKSAGTRELLSALKEKNNISEMIVQNLREELSLKQAEAPKSNHDL